MQRSAARHKYLEVWTVRYHFRKQRRCHHHLFIVIEHEQQVLLAEVGAQLLLHGLPPDFFEAERLRDGRQDELRVADLGQGDKTDATRKVVEEFGCHLHSQTRFADATGTSERQQANVWPPQEYRDCPYIILTPNEGRERCRQG